MKLTRNAHCSKWHDRYEPRTVDDLITEGLTLGIRQGISSLAKTEPLPNLVLHGLPGFGKTTLARILSNADGFDKEWLCRVQLAFWGLEGIAAMTASAHLFPRVVVVDEFDCLPPDYKAFLLDTMLDKKPRTSWIITQNSPVPVELADSFQGIDLTPVDALRPERERAMLRRLCAILHSEGLRSDDGDALQWIVAQTYPDMREAINMLQRDYGQLAPTMGSLAHIR